jgi:uncharacterized protein involved in response to NO
MVLEEPYRLFFPLGMLAGIWGVLMWPMFYGGHLSFYPNEAHARMMTAGFMGAFVAGFLGTAFPRLMGARRWMAGEFAAILLCWLLMVWAWARGMVKAGDEAFAMMIALLLAGMAVRSLRRRRDIPPPGFLLVFAGLVGAALSALWLARGTFVSVEWWKFARLWYFQGFLLLTMMGIGPYLLPRFFGMPSGHSFDTSVKAPAGWWRRAVASMIAGLCVITSFALEAWGQALVGQMLRAVVVPGWFAMETPIFRRAQQRTTPGTAVRWALVSMAAGLACSALWPLARIGSLHLFFVSGLALVTMAVGARVILGHAGRHDLLGGKIVWLRWVIGLAVLAAMTRMTSDFIPAVRVSHHIYAAWSWVAAALVWLVALWKYLWRSEQEQKPAGNCPRRSAAKRVSGPA